MADTLMIYNGSNPVHIAFGESVGADPFTINGRVAKGQFPPLKAWRLVRNSLSVPSNYKNILCESCYYYPAIKRRITGLKSRIININSGPLLYNIYSGRLKGLERRMLKSLLKEVDSHLVFGTYGVELLGKLDPGKPAGIVYPYISDDRYDALFRVKPDLSSKEMTIIGSDDIQCKGIDLLIRAFNQALESDKGLTLNIISNIPKENLEGFDSKRSGRINYLGMVPDIKSVLERSCLYVHPSRGDTYPRSSLEAMAAGVPSIVSNETGTKDVVGKIDPEMVCKVDEKDLAERIVRYFGLSKNEKESRSSAMRDLVRPFNKKEQLENFKKQFEALTQP